jgi:hypothetical protein
VALVGLAVAISASCSDEGVTPGGDSRAPELTLARMDAPDTAVAFSVKVSDQFGIKYVDVAVSGGVETAFADTIRTAQTTFTRQYTIAVPRAVPPGTRIQVIARATDGAGNESKADTLSLAAGNVTPPDVRITSPASGTTVVAGKNVLLGFSARSGLKVKYVGFRVTGAVTAADSTALGSPLRDSVSTLDTLAIPANASGQATVTSFVIDSTGQRFNGSSIALTVASPSSVTSTPVVSFGHTSRVEVTDTIQVSASDISGIKVLGYEVRDSTGTLVAADSAVFDGSFTPLFKTFRMNLAVSSFPAKRYLQAFARNGSGASTRAYAGGATARIDTVTVVAGVTHALPNGGTVADAYFHPRKDRLYLSNIARNRLDVFNMAQQSFDAQGIDVGSRPWGLAPWPANRDGSPGDTLLVANSGGTTVSYVNLNGAGAGREVYRYGLPNIVAYSVTSERSATTSEIIRVRRVYDFSDRPQYIAATCQGAVGPTVPCGDVVLVYSTQPTAGQTLPFPNQGTVRSENLTRQTSHFFFEQAIGTTAGRSDTLEIERFPAKDSRGAFNGVYAQLVKPEVVTVRVAELAFRDTTYVRNSGNFQRAVVAEGGAVENSRALLYDVTRGLEPVRQEIDLGVSPSTEVRDFIANTSTTIFGAAINFDGELAAIRGNASTALIGSTLRLQGLMSTTTANPGFDFHPRNAGTNSTPATRLAFAASAEPQIEIFDTFCYQRVAVLPVRDPIIGPIKSARRQNGQIVLVGATARGVVIANLADTFTTTCQQP